MGKAEVSQNAPPGFQWFLRDDVRLVTGGVAAGLSLIEMRRVVDAFIVLVEGLYAHLPLKRAMYGTDPVQRLRTLRQRVGVLDEQAFHGCLAEILTELRDAHTRYIGPSSLGGWVAVLPFLVESYGPWNDPRFVVSKVAEEEAEGLEEAGFVVGTTLETWNGVPIARAIDRYADSETGGRPDARRARALESLTFRPLRYGPPPDEYWVDLGFVAEEESREVRLHWRLLEIADEPIAAGQDSAGGVAFAGNPAAEAVRRAKKRLFASRMYFEHANRELTPVPAGDEIATGEWITGRFQDNVAAKVVRTVAGDFGYLRLWSFDLVDDDGFLSEVIELLERLPRRGLIIDLRANPGGLIWAAERLLQLFTPERISPTRFSMLATELTRAMAAASQNERMLGPWRRSLEAAVSSGELYSRETPLTPPELCRNLGQRYPGPVCAVVDANTYSAGDLFAAGFVDNHVGTLICVDKATGAGGANVWYPSHVSRALAGTAFADLARPLPAGISYAISFRRAVRSGPVAGQGIEDLGVRGHLEKPLTARDLLERNRDLLDFCGKLLASEPFTDLRITQLSEAPAVLSIETAGLDRVDVYGDEHPLVSEIVTDAAGGPPLEVPLGQGWSSIDVLGYAGEILRQRRRLVR